MSLLMTVKEHAKEILGINWWREAQEIANEARKQREEDEKNAPKDPHDMTRWLMEPSAYRRRAPKKRM